MLFNISWSVKSHISWTLFFFPYQVSNIGLHFSPCRRKYILRKWNIHVLSSRNYSLKKKSCISIQIKRWLLADAAFAVYSNFYFEGIQPMTIKKYICVCRFAHCCNVNNAIIMMRRLRADCAIRSFGEYNGRLFAPSILRFLLLTLINWLFFFYSFRFLTTNVRISCSSRVSDSVHCTIAALNRHKCTRTLIECLIYILSFFFFSSILRRSLPLWIRVGFNKYVHNWF